MCVYLVLEDTGQWESLSEFLKGANEKTNESYVAEVTGSQETGYQFRYISTTTNYLSGSYKTQGAAIQGLNLALLRSLVLNSSLSVFVVDDTEKVLYQSEKNISRFGMRQGQSCCEIKNSKTSWDAQEVFDEQLRLIVYREAG
jgi:hypothetical protein